VLTSVSALFLCLKTEDWLAISLTGIRLLFIFSENRSEVRKLKYLLQKNESEETLLIQ